MIFALNKTITIIDILQ